MLNYLERFSFMGDYTMDITNKIVDSNGKTIFFTDTNKSKSHILFFIHGNSSSHRTWDLQVTSDILNDFRMICFDLPGHGASSAAQTPLNEYSVIGTAEILGDAIKRLAASNDYSLVGHCSGSNIVAEMIGDNDIMPHRVVLISTNVVGGDFPLTSIFKQNPKLVTMFKDEVSPDEIADLWQSDGIMDQDRLHVLVNDHLSVDARYRSILSETVNKKLYSDEIQLIQTRNIPVLVIFGEEDSLVNTHYLDELQQTWTIRQIADAGHHVHITAPDTVNQLIAEFCSK